MSYKGDIRLGETIDVKFTTVGTTGAPTTLAGSPVVSAYVGNGTTEITAGITLTVDFDSRTGLHNVRVVASSGNGFATATNISLVITTGTVGGTSVVGYEIGSFSIENRSAVMPTTAARTLTIESDGMAHADVKELLGDGTSATDLKDFADAGYDPATNKVEGVKLADTLTTYTGNTVQTGDAYARIGANGASLSAIPWNASWDAEVQSECDDALIAKGLDHLVFTSVAGADIADNSIIAKMVSKSATADWDSFVNTTDALEAIRDKQTDIETDTAVIGAAGAGLTAIPWNASWDAEVESEATDALNAYDRPTNAEMVARTIAAASYATSSVLASALALLDDARSEPGQGAPPVNPDLATKIDYLYKAWRNKKTQTATEFKLFADDASTVDQKATTSDDGTTWTTGELATGP